MSKYMFEGRKFDNCIVFSDERYGEIRVMIEPDGKKLYAAIDIAACMGYAAPGKAIARSDIDGRIRMVPWVFKKRQGTTNTRCFTEEEARQFIDKGQELPKGFGDWFFGEVIRQSNELKSDVSDIEVEMETYRSFQSDMKSGSTMEEMLSKIDGIVLEILVLKKELTEKMIMF